MSTHTLSWLPLDVDEWRHRTQFCSLEEKGALLEAITASWSATLRGDVPGTLPASETALARLFGATWRRVIAAVREHFCEDPDNPSRLRCAWLAELYAAQLAKHASAVERGRKGGWPKGRERGKRNTSAIAQLKPGSTEVERDPVGGSFGAPHTGGVVAAAGRGGATAAPPPALTAPPDPTPLTTADVAAWAESQPAVRHEVERAVESRLDAENEGWRERQAGPGLRNRLIEAELHAACVRARRIGSIPGMLGPLTPIVSPLNGSLPGAAYA